MSNWLWYLGFLSSGLVCWILFFRPSFLPLPVLLVWEGQGWSGSGGLGFLLFQLVDCEIGFAGFLCTVELALMRKTIYKKRFLLA